MQVDFRTLLGMMEWLGVQMLVKPRAAGAFCHQVGGTVWDEAHTQEDRMKNKKKGEEICKDSTKLLINQTCMGFPIVPTNEASLLFKPM